MNEEDLVVLVERFIDCKAALFGDRRPTEVTCGYYFTRQNNLNFIRLHGLQPEQMAPGICEQGRGVHFGDGIYTSRNPEAFQGSCSDSVGLLVAIVKGKETNVTGPEPPIPDVDTVVGNMVIPKTEDSEQLGQAFQNFGNVGLLVAILKGNERNVRNAEPPNPAINTVIGNKVFPKTEGHGSGRNLDDKKTYNDEVVLRTSSQCLPLFSFSMRRYTYDNGQNKDWDNIWTCHERLQGVLDRFFNEGRTLSVHRQRN
mmetsp:Transcript_18957/g.32473  ORF Transcript_18957/g.32473 Transcript_18957/m.32473 type:complete len:256 (-) Transcript_18957:230-997(-)